MNGNVSSRITLGVVVLTCAICLDSLYDLPVSICNARMSHASTNGVKLYIHNTPINKMRNLMCILFQSLQASLAAARFVAFVRTRGSTPKLVQHAKHIHGFNTVTTRTNLSTFNLYCSLGRGRPILCTYSNMPRMDCYILIAFHTQRQSQLGHSSPLLESIVLSFAHSMQLCFPMLGH
jgi:hypothetical protein